MKANVHYSWLLMEFPGESEFVLFCASAADTGLLLGSVQLQVLKVKDAPLTASFSRLYVSTLARRRGIALRLLEECEAYASAAGCELVCAYVKPSNFDARKFYERAGYTMGYLWTDGDIAIAKRITPKEAA